MSENLELALIELLKGLTKLVNKVIEHIEKED